MCVGYDGVIPALVLLQVACIVITEEGIHHIRLLDLRGDNCLLLAHRP